MPIAPCCARRRCPRRLSEGQECGLLRPASDREPLAPYRSILPDGCPAGGRRRAGAAISGSGGSHRVVDRKSTRPELQSRLHLVCRLLLEKKKVTSSQPLPLLLDPDQIDGLRAHHHFVTSDYAVSVQRGVSLAPVPSCNSLHDARRSCAL